MKQEKKIIKFKQIETSEYLGKIYFVALGENGAWYKTIFGSNIW